MIYLILFGILALFTFVEVNLINKFDKGLNVWYIFLVCMLIIFAGTRFNTGFDYEQYRLLYPELNLTNFTSNTVEFGFAALNYLSRVAGLTFNGFLLLVAFITISLKAEFYRRHAMFISIALINYFSIGFLINDMGQIRHGLSIAVALYAMHDLINNNNKGFLVKSLLATLFHTSAIVLIPAYFLVKINLRPYLMLAVIVILLPFLFIDIRGFLFSIIDYMPFFQLQAKVTFYVYSDEFGKSLGFNLSFILRLVILFFLIYLSDTGKKLITGYNKLIILYFYGIVLYMVFNSIAEFATRASTFFKNLEPIILPFFVYNTKSILLKNVVTAFIIAYAFWSVYKIVYTDEFSVFFEPYNSFLLNYFNE